MSYSICNSIIYIIENTLGILIFKYNNALDTPFDKIKEKYKQIVDTRRIYYNKLSDAENHGNTIILRPANTFSQYNTRTYFTSHDINDDIDSYISKINKIYFTINSNINSIEKSFKANKNNPIKKVITALYNIRLDVKNIKANINKVRCSNKYNNEDKYNKYQIKINKLNSIMTELDKYKNISLQNSIYQHPMLVELNKNIEKVYDPELKPLIEYVLKHITSIIDKVNKEKEDRLNDYNKSIIIDSELDNILKPAMDFYKVKVDLRLELLDKILKNYSLAT